jgi:hypothetical protein
MKSAEQPQGLVFTFVANATLLMGHITIFTASFTYKIQAPS